jgi:hypothetical protein
MSLISVINRINYIIIHVLFLLIFFFILFILNHIYLYEQRFNFFFLFKGFLLTYNENYVFKF